MTAGGNAESPPAIGFSLMAWLLALSWGPLTFETLITKVMTSETAVAKEKGWAAAADRIHVL